MVVMGSALSRAGILLVLAMALGTSFVCERIAPYEVRWNHGRSDRWRDTLHAFVNESAIVASIAALPTIQAHVWHPKIWPANLPFIVQVLGSLVVLDAGITLVHYSSHRWNWLWRFHAVHHSVTRMYGFNGLMKHPVHQATETAGGMLPLLLLGIPPDVAATIAGLVVVQLLVQHSNVAYRSGPVAHLWIVNTAHRRHHLNRVPEGDVNFGLFLTVWDRMLGTYVRPGGSPVSDGHLGLADRADFPTGYWAQLVEPFAIRVGLPESMAQRNP